MRTKRIVVLLCGLMLTVFAVQVQADMYLKQATHSDAFEMMGQKQPETNDTTIMWLTEDKSCYQTPKMTFLVRADKGVMYMINNEEKSYVEMPVDLMGMLVDAAEADDSEAGEQVKAMAESVMGSMKVTVTPTDETKEIGDWDSKKYDVEMSMMMMKGTQEIWATEDIDVDPVLFQASMNAAMGQMPGFEGVLEEMKKIEGIPVESTLEMAVMGQTMKTTTKVLEAGEKDAPAGTYDLPTGYTKTEGMMPGGM